MILNEKIDVVSFLGNLCKNKHDYNNSGLSRRFIKDGLCTECRATTRKRWYKKNSNYAMSLSNKWRIVHREQTNNLAKQWRKKYPEKVKIAKINYRHKSPIRSQFINKRSNCKRLKLEFKLTLEELENLWKLQNGKCYWFKIPIFMDVPSRHPLKATLDRLHPTKGYTIDNVVWASSLANIGRSNCPITEFHEIIDNIINNKDTIL